MRTSVRWINDYLDKPASAEEQAELLTRAGLPFDGRHTIDGLIDDVCQEIETTSNRGDCLCHYGLAREVAALSSRTLTPVGKLSRTKTIAKGPLTSSLVKIVNREKALCPLYTARIIRGLKVGQSPPWLQERLRAIGQIPRNALVDASNFVLLELGQPTHVFDLAKLRGGQIIIRLAQENEPFLPIGEGAAEVKLSSKDLVIADAERAVAIGGVKGGALTAVTEATRDILIEAATFDPVTVRSSSRRLAISSDSSYRYERGVHAGQVNEAADRLTELILDLCGGELCEGVVSDGSPISPRREVTMRLDRCRKLLGIPLKDEQMIEPLRRLGFEPRVEGGIVHCTVPVHRLDIEREVDLIEEVLRMIGTDAIPIADSIQIRVAPPQATQTARQAVHDALAGMGFVETLTHSLVSEPAAMAFTPPDVELLRVADERAKAEPILRPSILPSLLRVYAHNRDNGVAGVRLFESAATFGLWRGQPIEIVNLALLLPADPRDLNLREARGIIERLVRLILGHDAVVDVEPLDGFKWLRPGASAKLGEQMLGTFGLLAPQAAALFGIDDSLCVAEIGLPSLYDKYPPITQARPLPAFPPIERDISALVPEQVSWEQVSGLMHGLKLTHLEAVDFVTTYRGKQIGAGRKSLTLRLRFRAADRTLTHEEVDAAAARAIAALKDKLSAEIRS